MGASPEGPGTCQGFSPEALPGAGLAASWLVWRGSASLLMNASLLIWLEQW